MVLARVALQSRFGSLLSRFKKRNRGRQCEFVWSLCVLLATCEDALRPRMDGWMDGWTSPPRERRRCLWFHMRTAALVRRWNALPVLMAG